MLTNGELEMYQLLAKSCCRIGLIPCNWEMSTATLTADKSIRKKIVVKVNEIMSILHSLFVFLRFPLSLEGYLNSKLPLPYLLVHGMVGLVGIGGLIHHIHLNLFANDAVLLTNRALRFNEQNGKYIEV